MVHQSAQSIGLVQSGALICKVIYWVLRNSNVFESSIVCNALLIDQYRNCYRTRVTKLLLEFSVWELHYELIAPASEEGLEDAKNCVTGEFVIRDTTLRNIIPGNIRLMQEHHEQIFVFNYYNTATNIQSSLNAWRKTKRKTLTKVLESVRASILSYTLKATVQSNSYFVCIQGEELHRRASLAADSMMWTSMEERGFYKWSCILRKCNDCGPLFNHDIKTYVSEGEPFILFNTSMKKGYCSIHFFAKL